MAEQVVTVPLLGGIDESVDPDQLKAPGMKELTNVIVRKKERFQKREGYALISEPNQPFDPATTYLPDGTVLDMPPMAEAINGHTGATASKIVTINDGRLYEYVGQNSVQEYRYVNDVPRAVGDIVPVDTSAGQCLEIESCVIRGPNGDLRVTAWTCARRPASVSADDSMWWELLDGIGVYVAIQRNDTGAFLYAPTRVALSPGILTFDARNLRMCEVYETAAAGPEGNVGCVVMWQQGPYNGAPQLWGFKVTPDGEVEDVINVTSSILSPGFTGLPPTWRSFDIAPARVLGQQFRFALVVCREDPSLTKDLDFYMVDATLPTGWTADYANNVFLSATVGRAWQPQCFRGVTLDYNRFAVQGEYSMTVRVGVTDAPAPAPIDMAIVTTLLVAQGSPVVYGPDPTGSRWGIIRDMNYQTYEDFSSIPGYAGTGGKKLLSKSVTDVKFVASIGQTASLTSSKVMTVNLPDGSKQLYTFQYENNFDGAGDSTTYTAYMSAPRVFDPKFLPPVIYQSWLNLAALRYGHQYPSALEFEVNIANTAVYSRGRQVAGLFYQLCGPTNRFVGSTAGYYAGVQLNVVAAGAPVVTAATTDVWITGGVDTATVVFAPIGSGLTNGTYVGRPLLINGNATALADIVVTGGQITGFAIAASGNGLVPAAGQTITLAAGAIYPGSPEIPSVATADINHYAAVILMVDGGDYNAAGYVAIRFGAANLVVGTGVPALPAGVHATQAYLCDWSNITNNGGSLYSFKDGANTLYPLTSAAFALQPQSCVHRWSSVVAPDFETSGSEVVLGVSATGANQVTTPSGDSPLSIASVLSTNNYFEVYKWNPLPLGETLLRPRVGSPPSSHLVSALAGPWRLIGDLCVVRRPSLNTVTDAGKRRVVCAITPSGDRQQQTQFLVYVGDTLSTAGIVPPLPDYGTSSLQWSYVNNKGMFVESVNAPRVLATPLNSARLFPIDETFSIGDSGPLYRTKEISGGLLRVGSSDNTCQVGAVSYDLKAEGWRQTVRYADYTLVNGGVLSSFDGSSCGEACIMLWPQRDLCTTATDRPVTLMNTDDQFFRDDIQLNLQAALWAQTVEAGALTTSIEQQIGTYGLAVLSNISRPYFIYEAGLRPGLNPSDSQPWARVSTTFGGDPLKDYQSINVDQRISVFGLNSAVSGNTAPGGKQSVTFYGKYGKYADIGNVVYWAPRNQQGKLNTGESMTKEGCYFDSIDTSCDMLMRWSYEVTDGTGRISRSAPSVPTRYTILTQLSASQKSNSVTGVGEFRYGFFAPRVELTNRLRVGADDNKRITTQPYTTAEPFGSVFYRMPFSSWLTPATSFVSERNSNRQLCPYVDVPYQSVNPYGYVLNNLKCFDGNNSEYLGILGMPYLYTTGGEVPNACPPSVRCMAIHQNRIVLGGADDKTVIWFSKELTESDAPAFSDLFTLRIADGGAVTGIGSLSRALIIFKSSQIHVLTGDMPDNTVSGGLTSSLGAPYRLVSGLGCVSPRSVVSSPVGVFFQSERTIELMGQDMAVSPIGLRVMDILEEYQDVVSATHKAVDSEVIFCCQKPNVVAGTNTQTDGRQFVLLVYNYADDIWSKHVMDAFGNGAAAVGEYNDQTMIAVGGRTYITSDTRFYDTTPNGDVWVTMSGETAPLALNQQQGYQRVKRIVLMGDPTPALPAPSTYQPHAMTVTVSTDWDSTQTATWTSAEVQSVLAKQGREFFGVHVRNQKCQKVSIRFQDAPPTGGAITTGYGVAFSNIALTVGVKSGLNKRMTQEAEH